MQIHQEVTSLPIDISLYKVVGDYCNDRTLNNA